jgi:hypothetical protein
MMSLYLRIDQRGVGGGGGWCGVGSTVYVYLHAQNLIHAKSAPPALL